MRLMLAALLFAHVGAAPLSDPLEQPPRCEDMRRLSDAANRAGSFQALFDEGFAPPILYGCRPADDGGYTCFRNVTPHEVTPASYGAIIRDCLHGATMGIEVDRLRDSEHVVRHGRFKATLDDHCTSICRAGRGMSINFTIDPDQPAIE